MGRMCPLQLQVNFNSGSFVTIPTTTHFLQWANRTHSNFKVLIILLNCRIKITSNEHNLKDVDLSKLYLND